jgi:hypothetical protein
MAIITIINCFYGDTTAPSAKRYDLGISALATLMASPLEVKHYLAHWFQLGKQVMSDDGRVSYRLQSVIWGDRFSPEFEQCWTEIMQNKGEAYYLKGTDQTIAQLLSPAWEIVDCARCDMPVPIAQKEIALHPCPCDDLSNWPNEEIPRPRLPINSRQRLDNLSARLRLNNLELSSDNSQELIN